MDDTTTTSEVVDATAEETETPSEQDTAASPESAAASAAAEKVEAALRQISEDEYTQYQRASAFHENIMADLQENPRQLLNALMETNPALAQHFEDIMAENYLRQIEEAKLSPEEKKQRELEAELKRYKEAEEAAKKQAEQAEVEAVQAEMQTLVQDAIKLTKLPIDGTLAAWTKRGLELAVANKIPLTPETLANFIRGKMLNSYGGYVDQLDGDDLLSAIGPKALEKLRAYEKAKAAKGALKGKFFAQDGREEKAPTKRQARTIFQILQEDVELSAPKRGKSKSTQEQMRSAGVLVGD